MFRILRAILQDSVCWLLLILLTSTVVFGLTALFNRYDRLDQSRQLLYRLEYDIWVLQKDIEQKQNWLARLDDDPNAWEQLGREKMNYLGPGEVLVTFVPEAAAAE